MRHIDSLSNPGAVVAANDEVIVIEADGNATGERLAPIFVRRSEFRPESVYVVYTRR